MVHYIENEYLKVGVKEFGAELTSIKAKDDGHEFLWQGDPTVWSGQSPVLFPIIGRLLDDKYYYNGTEYSLQKHGFFRKRAAALVSRSETEMTFVQENDEETYPQYPFAFKVFVTFSISGNSLKVTHEVKNINDKTMYFSLGAHPAFNCSIGDKLVFDENETLDTVSIDKESIRVAETTPVLRDEKDILITKDIFNNDALILSGIKSKNITLVSRDSDVRVKFDLGGCPYLGIWAKPGASYVCIEPWWGVNDSRERKNDISEKDGIVSLEAGKTFTAEWTAVFSK